MAQESLVQTILLENGLILEMYDQSRKVAGDRWLVKLVAKIDIPIDRLQTDAGEIRADDFKVLQASLGNCIRFQQGRERNFVDGRQKNAVFNDLLNSFLTSSQRYLAHPDFPLRYALREFRKRQQQRTWYRERSNGQKKT
ncbi:MAG: hypothetical protein JSW26_23085 [Desulfobacterales bacterium]|nr:MAG: hypothetical protein JSW26_23085 [Desulfobacterales bacterium]